MRLHKETALSDFGMGALKEILHLVISGLPISHQHRLEGPKGVPLEQGELCRVSMQELKLAEHYQARL